MIMGIDIIGRVTKTLSAVGGGDNTHIVLFSGAIFYVDAGAADDTEDGKTAETPKKTIAAGIALMAAGDALTVKAGDHDEDGLDLNLDGMELWGEIGAKILNTVGTECLTVSGDSCRVRGFDFEQAGVIGVVVTGDECIVENCRADGTTTGFDIDGDKNVLHNCQDLDSTVSGYDISSAGNLLRVCTSIAAGGASRGFYLSNAAADENTLINCHSLGNGTAGFEIVTGAMYNKIAHSTSGGGDGPTVDNGSFNDWPGFTDQLSTEHHEDIYPISTGQGVAGDPIAVSNSTTDGAGGTRDDQNYWGDITRIIPPDTLTSRWVNVGIYIHATATADIQQWEVLFTYADMVSAQNGGNDWDENEVDLTIADGTLFQDGDFVWITGNDRVEGEILLVSGAPAGNVVTIARETTADGEAGLRYDYDATGVNNRMYLVKRLGIPLYEGFEGDYSAGSARDWMRIDWHHDGKQLAPNGGMLMRMLNASDALGSSFDVRAIYED